ncbi:hypothetical protein VSA01S_32010 [Vibrio sagamiensis NBRC 104589]|uniref:Uncharacterized protein n=1 Tax=Vibrio sagamiensis NBRC 104589 TaxID=1219064 RepID=A0A511QIF0_9VIBR|nr:hypothetical protein VSA01S_32010 [Vibrio sagamiensis NBRC 104589]
MSKYDYILKCPYKEKYAEQSRAMVYARIESINGYNLLRLMIYEYKNKNKPVLGQFNFRRRLEGRKVRI